MSELDHVLFLTAILYLVALALIFLAILCYLISKIWEAIRNVKNKFIKLFSTIGK